MKQNLKSEAFPIGVNNWKQYGLKYGYWNFFETEIRKDWITLSSKHQRLREEIQKISKWPEPSPKTGEGGPGSLWTSGLLTQYQHDKEKHEKEIADILKLLE